MLDITYGDIKVFYEKELDGGGIAFQKEFSYAIKDTVKKANHIYEFASGPGFLGFSCLAKGLCNRLTLSDINSKAIDICNKTIKHNNLYKEVTAIQSDGLKNIPYPHSLYKFDLVISNPPHINDIIKDTDVSSNIYHDPQWQIHEDFYKNIKKYLNKHASIIFLEHNSGKGQEIFIKQILKNNLIVEGIFNYPQSDMYFIWTRND